MVRYIPKGQVKSYSWVAKRIKNPKAVRSVGTALNKNPFPIIIPCHRVVNSDGSFGEYAFGRSLKKRLLEIEKLCSKK